MTNFLKQAGWVTAVVGAMVGCSASGRLASYGYRANTTVAQLDKDNFDCRVAAANQVPANTQINSTPGYITPVQTQCRVRGYTTQCTSYGGERLGGETYSYDANRGLRAEYFQRCLASKGYQVFSLPTCPQGSVSPELRSALTGKLRTPSEGACLVQVTSNVPNIAFPGELTP